MLMAAGCDWCTTADMKAAECRLDVLWREFGGGSFEGDEAGAVAEEFRRPHSSTAIWASAWQKMAPWGGQRVHSASALAAVPVATGKTATSRSNNCDIRSRRRSVSGSSP